MSKLKCSPLHFNSKNYLKIHLYLILIILTHPKSVKIKLIHKLTNFFSCISFKKIPGRNLICYICKLVDFVAQWYLLSAQHFVLFYVHIFVSKINRNVSKNVWVVNLTFHQKKKYLSSFHMKSR